MRFLTYFLFIAPFAMALSACTTAESATPAADEGTIIPTTTATAMPADTPAPTPTTAAATAESPQETPTTGEPASEEIGIEVSDGLTIHATLYRPANVTTPRPGVILLHMLGDNRQAWVQSGFARALAENGYVALAIDMRGHGDTGGARDWDLVAKDVAEVYDYVVGLEEVDEAKTAVIGASIGANLALITGANKSSVAAVILLSPGLDYRGVTTPESMGAYTPRPILIVASEEDSYAADSATSLAEIAQGDVMLEMYNDAGHGTNMFTHEPELTERLIHWLDRQLKQET